MQFTINTLGAAIVATAGIVAAATYHLRQERIDVLEDKIKTYEAYEKIDFPKLSKSLLTASDDLSTQIKTLSDIKELTARNNELNTLYSQLETANKNLKDENKSLVEKLQSLSIVDQSFTVKQGASHKILNNNYSIGVKNVYYGDADFTFENKTYRLPAGSHIPLTHEDLTCKIVVDSISFSDAQVGISIVCKKNKAAT